MRNLSRMIVLVLIAGIIFGISNPFNAYGCETPGGNAWDIVLDPGPFPGISLTGPLSIYYDVLFNKDGSPKSCMADTSFLTNMYYTLRITKNRTTNTFQGKAKKVCLADLATQATIIRSFLETSVIPDFFLNDYKSWKFKSVENAYYHFQDDSVAFVADIEIVVKKK